MDVVVECGPVVVAVFEQQQAEGKAFGGMFVSDFFTAAEAELWPDDKPNA